MVSIVPTSDFVIRGLQFFTELETCLAVQVWYVPYCVMDVLP
jgi:hypothetical protein